MVFSTPAEVMLEWQHLGSASRFFIVEVRDGAMSVQYIGSKRQGYTEFLNQLTEEKCAFGFFAFEEIAPVVDAEEERPSTFKTLLAVWVGDRAPAAAKGFMPLAEEALEHSLAAAVASIALRVHARTKADLDYCEVLDRVLPRGAGEDADEAFEDDWYEEEEGEEDADEAFEDDWYEEEEGEEDADEAFEDDWYEEEEGEEEWEEGGEEAWGPCPNGTG
eukprot:EG_transcript_22508